MPRLIPYDQQVIPQQQLQVQAGPDDFGAAVGRGIEAVGQGVENITNSINAVEQDKAKVWAINAASEARLSWINNMQAMQTDPEFQKKYGADGSKFVDTFKTQYEDFAANALAEAPDGASRRFLEGQLHQVGNGLMNDAINFQAITGAKWSASQLAQSQENYGRAAFQRPDQFGSIVASNEAGIDTAPHLDEATRLEMKMKSREDIAFAAGKGMAQQNPEAVLATLAPEELAKFKPTSRVVKALNSNYAVVLPRNIGGDTVKPYAADKIAHIAQKTKEVSQYDAMIQQAAQAHGVDATELKMRLVAESDLDPNAKSKQDCVGLAQFTEATAKAMGVTDRTNAQQSIFGAAKLLADLQGKAAGDLGTVDQMYYGGESGSNWGKNTAQYAENLAAVRSTMTGNTEAPPATFEQVLASVLDDKAEPVRSDRMPDWFNQLPWEKQYAIIEDAKQGTSANQTREAQLQALQEKQREIEEKQGMSEGIDKLIDGSLTVDQIRNDPRLGYTGKHALLEAINGDLVGRNKTDPQVFNDLFQRVNSPAGTTGHISDEGELVKYVGHGIAYEQLGQLRKEIQDKGTPEGSVIAQTKEAFIKSAYQKLVKTSMFQAIDPTQADNYYKFQQAFLTTFDAKRKAGVDPRDLLNPASKEYLGYMIQQFDRTPQEVMAAMKAERMRQMATPSGKPAPDNPQPGEVVVINGVQWRFKGGNRGDKTNWEKVE